MSMLKAFDEFVAENKANKLSVQKMKDLNKPEMHNSREITIGDKFVGQITLKHFEETQWGPGFIVLVNGGYTMRTSLVREVVKKSPTKWLLKTLNSVYKVEVEAE